MGERGMGEAEVGGRGRKRGGEREIVQ